MKRIGLAVSPFGFGDDAATTGELSFQHVHVALEVKRLAGDF